MRIALLAVLALAAGCSKEPETHEINIKINGEPLPTAKEQKEYRDALGDMKGVRQERERLQQELDALAKSSPSEYEAALAGVNAVMGEFTERMKADPIASRRWFLERVKGKSPKDFIQTPSLPQSSD